MKRKTLSLLSWLLILSVLLLLLNYSAQILYLYWTTWWMDIINHALGGAIVCLASKVCSQFTNSQFSGRKVFVATILFTLIIGVLWEGFELYFGLTFVDGTKYWSDTLLDLIMDVAGSSIAFIYLKDKN